MRIEDLERGDYISYYRNKNCIGKVIGFNPMGHVVVRPDSEDGWVADAEQQTFYGISDEDRGKCWALHIDEVNEIISSASKYPRIKTQFLGGLNEFL